MKIKSTLTNHTGEILNTIYYEGVDPADDMKGKVLQGVHAFCFCNGKLVLVNHPKGGWIPPGGGIELGETYEEAVIREVREETNMKVIHQELIGFLDTEEPDNIVIRQTRSFCIVEPYGEFGGDPDGEITEIKLINPEDYRKYFDWGEVGDRIMTRAVQLKKKLD